MESGALNTFAGQSHKTLHYNDSQFDVSVVTFDRQSFALINFFIRSRNLIFFVIFGCNHIDINMCI